MGDRETELKRVRDDLRETDGVADAFLAKSFTDRHLVVDVTRDVLPGGLTERLATYDLYPADEVYDEGSARSAVGDVDDATRHHFVDVQTRGSHQSYVVE